MTSTEAHAVARELGSEPDSTPPPDSRAERFVRQGGLHPETAVLVALLAMMFVLLSAFLYSTYFGVYVGGSHHRVPGAAMNVMQGPASPAVLG